MGKKMSEVKVMKVRTSRFDKNPEADIEVVLKSDYDKLSNQRDSMIIIQSLSETLEKQKKEIDSLKDVLRSMHIDTPMGWDLDKIDLQTAIGWHKSNNQKIEAALKRGS
jgi:hypothetical protein